MYNNICTNHRTKVNILVGVDYKRVIFVPKIVFRPEYIIIKKLIDYRKNTTYKKTTKILTKSTLITLWLSTILEY